MKLTSLVKAHVGVWLAHAFGMCTGGILVLLAGAALSEAPLMMYILLGSLAIIFTTFSWMVAHMLEGRILRDMEHLVGYMRLRSLQRPTWADHKKISDKARKAYTKKRARARTVQ